MAARKLEAVPDDYKKNSDHADETPQTITSAAESSHRDLLVALRTTVAQQIDEGPPAHALDKLVRIIRELNHEIAEIDAVDEGDDVSDAAETPDEPWTA